LKSGSGSLGLLNSGSGSAEPWLAGLVVPVLGRLGAELIGAGDSLSSNLAVIRVSSSVNLANSIVRAIGRKPALRSLTRTDFLLAGTAGSMMSNGVAWPVDWPSIEICALDGSLAIMSIRGLGTSFAVCFGSPPQTSSSCAAKPRARIRALYDLPFSSLAV